jgi:acyl-CoA reductase-like NAD-dependent aldehyde dehydrogenase
MTVQATTETLSMFVDGAWAAASGDGRFEATSPSTGETIATIPSGTRADAERAVDRRSSGRRSSNGSWA